MTTRTYTDGDDASSQPTIRSAWDAVKRDVMRLSILSAGAGFDICASHLSLADGHRITAGFTIVAGLLCGAVATANGVVMANKLKQVEAPPHP